VSVGGGEVGAVRGRGELSGIRYSGEKPTSWETVEDDPEQQSFALLNPNCVTTR